MSKKEKQPTTLTEIIFIAPRWGDQWGDPSRLEHAKTLAATTK